MPNVEGGRENLEAIAFLKRLNEVVYGECEGVATFAEESTSFPGISRPTDTGGLGFGYKWNMGWMNDTLDYMKRDPVHRRHHHHQMTFGIHYALYGDFVLPLSTTRVVHGKGSILARMPGDDDQRFANLRAYFAFMWAHPGKKLLFMGQEFAQVHEWNHEAGLDWHLLGDARHAGVQRLVRDLNRLYRSTPALHELDCEGAGFEWIEADAAGESLFAWLRRGRGERRAGGRGLQLHAGGAGAATPRRAGGRALDRAHQHLMAPSTAAEAGASSAASGAKPRNATAGQTPSRSACRPSRP